MKNKFYIMTALIISLTGCSSIEDGTLPTVNFPEDHIIRVVTEVKAPVSRAGYDASNLESFGSTIDLVNRKSEAITFSSVVWLLCMLIANGVSKPASEM